MRSNNWEQYTRLNCLELRGVPEVRGENVIATVSTVAKALHFPVETNMIDACHRLKANPRKLQEPRPIILKLVSRIQKDTFLQAKQVKRTLNTKDVDPTITNPAPIYINESLTADNRRLFEEC